MQVEVAWPDFSATSDGSIYNAAPCMNVRKLAVSSWKTFPTLSERRRLRRIDASLADTITTQVKMRWDEASEECQRPVAMHQCSEGRLQSKGSKKISSPRNSV